MTPENGPVRKTCSIQEACDVLGWRNIFGPNDWNVSFTNINLSNIPEIPWTKDELKHPVLKQPHFLFLGLKSLTGRVDEDLTLTDILNIEDYLKPLNPNDIPVLQRQFVDRGKVLNDLRKKKFSQKIQTRWYIMPIGYIRNLRSVNNFGDLVAGLPINYKVPSATEFALANTLYYLHNHKFMLDKDRPALTNEFVNAHMATERRYGEMIEDYYEKEVSVKNSATAFCIEQTQGRDVLRIIDGAEIKFINLETVAALVKLPK